MQLVLERNVQTRLCIKMMPGYLVSLANTFVGEWSLSSEQEEQRTKGGCRHMEVLQRDKR